MRIRNLILGDHLIMAKNAENCQSMVLKLEFKKTYLNLGIIISKLNLWKVTENRQKSIIFHVNFV